LAGRDHQRGHTSDSRPARGISGVTEGNLRLAHLVPVEATDSARLLTVAAAASRRESGDPLAAAGRGTDRRRAGE
jgi:hypothetical protein